MNNIEEGILATKPRSKPRHGGVLQTPAKIKARISWLLAGGTRRRPPSNRRRRMEAVAGLFEAQRKAIEPT
jgi:hypothetical protein